MRAEGGITAKEVLSYAFPVSANAVYFLPVSSAYNDAGIAFYLHSNAVTAFWANSGGSQRSVTSPWMSGVPLPSGISFEVRWQMYTGHTSDQGALSVHPDDTTISGDGTVGDPLKVVTPLTTAEKSKLAGIASNATATTDQDIRDVVRNFLHGATDEIDIAHDSDLHRLTLELSGESFTAADKSKLDGIQAGATAGGGSSPGIASVVSDSTLDGVGTAADPLSVAVPYSTAEKAKLANLSDHSDDEFWKDVSGQLASTPSVFVGSNTKFTPTTARRASVYEVVYTAPTNLANEWILVRFPYVNPDLSESRVAAGSNVYYGASLEHVLDSAPTFSLYQVRISCSQGDKIRVQQYRLKERLTPDPSDLTAYDDYDVLAYRHGMGDNGLVFAGIDGTNGTVVTGDDVSGAIKIRTFWSGNTLLKGTDLDKFADGDMFVLAGSTTGDPDGVYEVTPQNVATSSITRTYIPGNAPAPNQGKVGYNRNPGSTNFGPNPAPFPNVPIRESEAEDGTQIFTSLTLGATGNDYATLVTGTVSSRLDFVALQGGLRRYANRLTGQLLTSGTSVTETIHASAGKPFTETVRHLRLVRAFGSDIQGNRIAPLPFPATEKILAVDSNGVKFIDMITGYTDAMADLRILPWARADNDDLIPIAKIPDITIDKLPFTLETETAFQARQTSTLTVGQWYMTY